MAPEPPENLTPAGHALPTPSDNLHDRLAEAARYAVLRRVFPVLRHDVAGSLQPVRMLLMVLERRVQKTNPDLAAITKSVTSLGALTIQAAADCMNALGWLDSSQDPQVGLRHGVDEAGKLLALELSANPLTLVNGVEDDAITAPQSFFRSVFMGALLAFCDQHVASASLLVTFQRAAADSPHAGQFHLRLLPTDAGQSPPLPDEVRGPRKIVWPDVQAMARSCGVRMARGDGWLTLDLPRP